MQNIIVSVLGLTVSQCFADYALLPSCLKNCFPYFVASILYHHSFLKTNLSPNHPLWFTRMFTNKFSLCGRNQSLLEFFQKRILLGSYRCLATGMTASGIPNHLLIVERLDRMEKSIETLSNNMAASFAKFEAHLVENRKEIPNDVKVMLKNSYELPPERGLSRDEFYDSQNRQTAAFDLRWSALEALIQRIEHNHGAAPSSTVNGQGSVVSSLNGNLPEPKYNVFTWGGRMHVYPQDFHMECLTMKQAWSMWHFGDPAKQMMPLSRFGVNHAFSNNRPGQSNYTKLSKVMTAIISTIREKALIPETKLIEALTNEEFDACYCKAFKILSDFVYRNNVNSKYESRPDQIKAMTFANAYYKVFGSM